MFNVLAVFAVFACVRDSPSEVDNTRAGCKDICMARLHIDTVVGQKVGVAHVDVSDQALQ